MSDEEEIDYGADSDADAGGAEVVNTQAAGVGGDGDDGGAKQRNAGGSG